MLDSLHILIVDDRPDGVLFLSEFLHTRNHVVEISNDGQEALEAVLRRFRTHDAYDLVIAALTMAKLDGLALLRHLRRRGVDTPASLYAAPGAVTPEISQQAKIHGCLAILEKPLSLQRIERLLDEMMRRRGPATGTTIAPPTASQRRDDDKPFFGTSRIMRIDDQAPAAPPSPASPALERIRRPSSVELQPEVLPAPPAGVSLPPIPPVGGGALTPTGLRTVPPPRPPPPPPSLPPPMSAPATPPPSVPPPVAPPSTAFFRARPADTRSSTRHGTSAFRRAVEPPVRTPTNAYSRRHSGLFTVPADQDVPPIAPTSTTARIRRTISGVQQPVPPSGGVLPPTTGPNSHPVACAHCRQVFLVVSKPQSYTVVCVHCGQLNRIDPF